MPTKKQKKKLWNLAVEFIKLQLSANILFWGTLAGLFVLHELLEWPQFAALATASIAAHVVFFIVNKEWVFDDKSGKRKTGSEVVRFVVFMGINYFINLGIVTALSHFFDLSPYIGQVVAAIFFTGWNFIGLKFWVFQDVKHHSLRTNYVKAKKKVKHHAKRAVRRVRNAT